MDRYWVETAVEHPDGGFVQYQDAQDAIATARAEALMEAADKAVEFVIYNTRGYDLVLDDLCAAILADKQEGKNGAD